WSRNCVNGQGETRGTSLAPWPQILYKLGESWLLYHQVRHPTPALFQSPTKPRSEVACRNPYWTRFTAISFKRDSCALTLRRNSITTRIEHMANRLLDAQHDVQERVWLPGAPARRLGLRHHYKPLTP